MCVVVTHHLHGIGSIHRSRAIHDCIPRALDAIPPEITVHCPVSTNHRSNTSARVSEQLFEPFNERKATVLRRVTSISEHMHKHAITGDSL